MKPLGKYDNGNYTVVIFDDGTKVRFNNNSTFEPEKPESIDIKITNRCDMGCPMCHEDSKPDGKHADIVNVPFLDTLLPYTELAIGGGNPMEHPQLWYFLDKCKSKNLIANMTVHQKHFLGYDQAIQFLVERKLIHGLGVSITKVDDELLEQLSKYPNAVVHVINGVIAMDELRKLYDHNLKILILGYKDFRRGVSAHSALTDSRMNEMYSELPEMLGRFKTVSFDNLAIKQLNAKRLMSEEEWNEFYMGDDGQFTMYIDLVKREFAKSSTSTERFKLTDDIKTMFDMVKR